MKFGHVEDRAALYALGALSDAERAQMDEHFRECSACAAAVGQAEEDVARIVATEPQRTAPPSLQTRLRTIALPPVSRPAVRSRMPSWPYAAALAAALVLGLLPSVYFISANRAMHDVIMAQSSAMDRLATGPHRTAQFRPTTESPPAQVMYAVDGSWYLVVVRNATKPLSVAWMHDGVHTMLGNAVPRGRLAMLYLPKSHRMDRLALMDGTRVVAEATLSWRNALLPRYRARAG